MGHPDSTNLDKCQKKPWGTQGISSPKPSHALPALASQDSRCRWSQSQETLPRPRPFILDTHRGLRGGVTIWTIGTCFQPIYLDFRSYWFAMLDFKLLSMLVLHIRTPGLVWFFILISSARATSLKAASLQVMLLFPLVVRWHWEMGSVLRLLWLSRSEFRGPHQCCEVPGYPICPATLYLDRRDEVVSLDHQEIFVPRLSTQANKLFCSISNFA